MDQVIKVENVSKVYPLYDRPYDRVREALSWNRRKYHKDFYALKNVNIEVNRGSCVGIIGMNGSGKSTLLQLIAGVVIPTTGHISVSGKVSALLELGAGFNPEYNGIENIKFQCALMSVPSQDVPDVIREVEAFAEIGDFIYQPVKSYSSGMYVRLAFATAINVNPDILIVDEALAVGDIYFQTKCLNKIRRFREENKTLLFVSHDAAAVKSLCDHAYLLHKGELLDSGTPDKVFDHYNNLIAVKEGQESFRNPLEMRQRYGSGKVKITSVRIKNAAGVFTDTITTAEKISIEIRIKVNASVPSPTIGLSIRDRLGIEIYGINNHNLGIDFGAANSGEEWLVCYDIPMKLGPNTYNIAVSAHPEDTHIIDCYDWWNEACIFRIVPSPHHKFVGCALLDAEVHVVK
jgi:lipopolysaccharide transport system ATP-binding protein